MKSRLALLFLSTALAACSQFEARGGAAAGGASAPSNTDARFMRDISHAYLAEIASGRLAAQKAQSPAVKRFGQEMVDEHSALQSEAGALEQAKGMKPPTTPDLRHQAAMQKLEAASGDAFDHDYVQQTVADHTNTLELLQEAAWSATDARVRELAQKAIAPVRQHLDMAQRLSGDAVGRAQ